MSKKRRAVCEINVVPYIDVMLVLLIIFMITAPIVQQGVTVELPKLSANSLPPDQLEPFVLTVSKNGEYTIDIGDDRKKPVSDEVVMRSVALILKQKPQTPILVRGDKGVVYDLVVHAMALLQRAGAEKVGLMTDAP